MLFYVQALYNISTPKASGILYNSFFPLIDPEPWT